MLGVLPGAERLVVCVGRVFASLFRTGALVGALWVSPALAATAQHGAVPPETADSAEAARKASSIARQTMSPFCPGRTLSDCPSPDAADWRRDIREMVERGMTSAEIQTELEKRAGGNLSGIPNRKASYAVPIGLAGAAALILYFVLTRLRRKEKPVRKVPAEEEKPKASVDDQRLQDELDVEE